jgi:phage internal scaffolding protein
MKLMEIKMAKIPFKTAYSEKDRVQVETVGESLTQQHFEKEQDVRNIIKAYDRTGLITNVARGVAQYGDYSEVNEYREALDMIMNANASFSELPAQIRQMFDNDAGAFFEFATNPANEEKMVELGLKEAPVSEIPVEATETQPEAVEPPTPS